MFIVVGIIVFLVGIMLLMVEFLFRCILGIIVICLKINGIFVVLISCWCVLVFIGMFLVYIFIGVFLVVSNL